MTMNALRLLAVAISLAFIASDVRGQSPMGSVTVSGNADSLYSAFLAHLRGKSIVIQSQDSKQRTVRFVMPEASGEATDARFTAQRDSTRIDAQGARGGMLALIMGLGAVREMLATRETKRALRPDSTSPPLVPRTP